VASVLFKNNARTALASGITDVATTATVVNGSVFPSPTGGDYFYATFETDAFVREIVKVTARSTNALTIVRAQEGTTASAFSANDACDLRVTAGVLTDALNERLSVAALAANVQSYLGAADYSAMRSQLGLVIGTNVQAYDADLTTWAGVTPGTGVATFLATPTSANLQAAVTGETGTGALVFGTSPTIASPTLSGTVTVTGDLTTSATVTAPYYAASSVGPFYSLYETDQGADLKRSYWIAVNGTVSFRLVDDAFTTDTALINISRSTHLSGTIDFPAAVTALTRSGNTILHAGNVGTYALPIGGGTVTGAVVLTVANAAMSMANNYISLSNATGPSGHIGGNGPQLDVSAANTDLVIRAESGLWISIAGASRAAYLSSAGLQARVALGTTMTGTLVAADQNTTGQLTGGLTVPASVFVAEDKIHRRAGSSARTITQGTGLTMRLHGSATTGNLTLAAYGAMVIDFVSATECVVSGDVS